MTCNAADEFVGETHTCIGLPGHDSFHSCGCKPARIWNRLDERGLTADDEPVQRRTGKRLSADQLAMIRRTAECAGEHPVLAGALPGDVLALLDHIDAIESDLASCRAGQPRHKDQP